MRTKEISEKKNEEKVVDIPGKKLKIASEYADIFDIFERDQSQIIKRISQRGFDRKHPLKVKKNGENYDILCGIGRFDTVVKQQKPIGGISTVTMPCIVVKANTEEEKEAVRRLIIKDNFETCFPETGLSPYQFYLLGRLLHECGECGYTKESVEDRVKLHLNISDTIFSYLEKITEFILKRCDDRKAQQQQEDVENEQ